MTSPNNSAQMLSLRRPDCPATLLELHLNDQDDDIRSAIASNPALSDAQQNQLAADKSVAVRLALLSNPALSANIMARLLEDSNLRAALAAALSATREDTNLSGAPETAALAEIVVCEAPLHQPSSCSSFTEAQQVQLLEEGDEQQRAELASHPYLSKSLQSRLLQDKDESVLIALAGNPSLLDEGQEKLASTGSPAVREALAGNPGLNETQQNYLATTGSDRVKCRLAKNPSLIIDFQSMLASDKCGAVREALACNPSLDMAYQSQLIEDIDVDVKIALAGNPALPNDLRLCLANSNEDRVIASLAKNPSLSDALMEKYAVSGIREVKEALASNTSLPESLQARLIAYNADKLDFLSLFGGLGGNFRNILARNPSLKVAQQAELAKVGDIDVRLALLDNPSLHESVKTKIIASFGKDDLTRAQGDFDYAEKQALRLNAEYLNSCKKYERSMGWSMGWLFPTSDAKLDRLYDNTVRTQEREREAWSECLDLGGKCSKLKCALEQQSKTLNNSAP